MTDTTAITAPLLTVDVVLCLVCKDLIYSRSRHDYHACQCGHTTVDGGRDYLRLGWNGAPQPVTFRAELCASTQALVFDWNWNKDLYGWSSQLRNLPKSALTVLRDHIAPSENPRMVSRTLADTAPTKGLNALKRRGLVTWDGAAWTITPNLPFRLECLGRRRLRAKPRQEADASSCSA